jgi:ABC-2 type transport system permease protein
MNNDVTEGIFERFHSMPIAKSSVLWGHVISSTISCFISLIVIVLLALLMGFRSSASILEWFEATGIILLFTLATTWMAILSGLLAKTAEGAGVFSYPLIFLPFISSAFVPTATMPTPVRVFAENQPVTSIVESVRGLLLGQPVSNDIWMALAWHVGLLVLMYVLAIRAYKRKMR